MLKSMLQLKRVLENNSPASYFTDNNRGPKREKMYLEAKSNLAPGTTPTPLCMCGLGTFLRGNTETATNPPGGFLWAWHNANCSLTGSPLVLDVALS